MNTGALFEQLRKFDTPTICNALEVVRGKRFTNGFTRQRLIAAFPEAAAHRRLRADRDVPLLRAVSIVAARKQKLLGYYEYVAQPNQPCISVVQDIDSQPGLGAFWGEVNTTVHWGLGCVGAVTNGSMRDLDAMCPQFQCLAATLSPSHAFGQVVEFGKPVDVLGMAVSDGDIVHADHARRGRVQARGTGQAARRHRPHGPAREGHPGRGAQAGIRLRHAARGAGRRRASQIAAIGARPARLLLL